MKIGLRTSGRARSAAVWAFAAGTACLAASLAFPALAAAQSAGDQATRGPVLYQGKRTGLHVVLGPQSNPTHLAETPKLPAGSYEVTTITGAVIASQDQIVCAVGNVPDGNDGVFGTAGNPGTGFIYGTATITDTVRVSAGQRIYLTCNSFNYGKGTWVGSAVVDAIPVSTVESTSAS
jgi:hypothetical protein